MGSTVYQTFAITWIQVKAHVATWSIDLTTNFDIGCIMFFLVQRFHGNIAVLWCVAKFNRVSHSACSFSGEGGVLMFYFYII